MEESVRPKVSVIIPTYNRADLLPRSIQSVLDQTYKNLEIIVVDDGSRDGTQQRVRSINDHRLKCARHPKNRGAAASRNTGIELASGKYIAFQDDDDQWLPEKLEKQVHILETTSNKVGMVYSDMWRVSQGKKNYYHSPKFLPSDGIVYKEALAYGVGFIGLQSVLFRSECFDRIGLFDENLRCFIDLELFIRVSKYYYLYHINEPLVNHYWTEGSISTDLNVRIQAREYIMKKYLPDVVRDRKLLCRHFVLLGRNYCDSGSIKNGFECLLKGIYYSRFRLSYVTYFLWRLFLACAQLLTGERTERIRREMELRYYASKYSKRKLL